MFSMTIRMNGSEDTVTVDGHKFDRSKMTKPDRNKLRRMVVEAYEQQRGVSK